MRLLTIFALEPEAQGLFDDSAPVFCGVGKVNAAYHLMQALERFRATHGQAPELVLNLGSAGSGLFNRGLVVNCTSFMQRDFDVTALGCPPYTTPFDPTPAHLVNGQRYSALPEGICGSGDQFVTAASSAPWNVIDMEAFALAKVCLHEQIPFACLKYITDGADGHAPTAWQDGLKHTAAALRAAMEENILRP
ncbi:MAG: nucleosidase [Alphaproteobacteria bacterium]|nr:nucleosidase [Alphaproteobacteria bacterium]